MNDSTGPLTIARVHQRISFSDFIRQTNFAAAFEFLLDMENVFPRSVHLFKIKRLCFLCVIYFEDHKLNSAQLDKVPND